MENDFPSLSLCRALAHYADWLATTHHYTERSKREYLDDASVLVVWLERRCGVRSAPSVQREHLRGFLAHCRAVGQASSTRRCSVAAIRAFFTFLVQEHVLRDSPAEYLFPPEREVRPPRVLSAVEYERLRHAARGNPRDAAIIELALQTGIRLSEMSRLALTDVILPVPIDGTPLSVGHLRIAGRGRSARTVTLNTKACAALRSYLAVREPSDSTALFLTKFERGIGPRGIENLVAKYCKEAGISGASVRTLRHTMAVKMLKLGIHIPSAHDSTAPTLSQRHGATEFTQLQVIEMALGGGRGVAEQCGDGDDGAAMAQGALCVRAGLRGRAAGHRRSPGHAVARDARGRWVKERGGVRRPFP